MSFVVMDENTLRKWGGTEMKMVGAEEQERIMREQEEVRAEAEAHGCGYRDIPIQEIPGGGMICKRVYEPVRPLPCVRDEHGSRETWLVRDVLAKCDEERREFEAEIFSCFGIDTGCGDCGSMPKGERKRILNEWADMQVANTSAIVAIIGATQEELDEAIRRVNGKNRERRRL